MKTPSRQFWIALLLFFLAWGVGLALIPLRRPGGDSIEMADYVERQQSVYYFRSPFTLYLHRAVYHAIHPFGGSGADAIALCSAAAGGVFLLALLTISRHPLFLAFNLLAGSTFLFFGHVENYAWVNALLVLFLAFLKKHVDEGRPLWPAAFTLFLACLMHMLAVFTLPVLALAMFDWDKTARRPRRRIPERDFEIIMLWFVTTLLIVVFMPLTEQTAGLDNNFQRLVPLLHLPAPGAPGAERYFFTMFSAGHIRMLAHFHWMASPLGLFVLVALGRRIRGRFQRLTLAAAVCGLGWTFVWHPDMGRADWDLFASFAFPLNVLDGLLLAGLWRSARERRKISPAPGGNP